MGRRRWLICSAWPYSYDVPHLGNLIGSSLSADVVARYLRMKGDEVLFVSGSDEHGAPIEVKALKIGMSPRELTDKCHALLCDLNNRWGISFDNYTRTESRIHMDFVREFYMRLYERGYIFEDYMELPYCNRCERFLPDRFVEGICPHCGYGRARGDQCEECGRLLEPTNLVNPKCGICGSIPEVRRTKHWFIDLPKLEEEVRRYLEQNDRLPENARKMCLAILDEGLRPRALTRDNKWGIPAPFPGAEDKTIYVWMEAVLGYISASIEYSVGRSDGEGWKRFWLDGETRSVYFIGKDNIPFHAIILPALLIAHGGGYVLPWTLSSTEYLLFEGEKFSKSKGVGIWIDEALDLLPSDYWRFALIAFRPECRDMSFTWEGLKSAVNALLNDTIGNFVHRTITFIHKHFDGKAPEPSRMGEFRGILNEIEERIRSVGNHMEELRLRDALMEIVKLAQLGNKFLDDRKPWSLVRRDRDEAATVMYVCLAIVKALATLIAPFMPIKADELWCMLNLPGSVHDNPWDEALKPIDPLHELGSPKPPFEKVADEEFKAMMDELAKRRFS